LIESDTTDPIHFFHLPLRIGAATSVAAVSQLALLDHKPSHALRRHVDWQFDAILAI
jgi:hypothetical protein